MSEIEIYCLKILYKNNYKFTPRLIENISVGDYQH